MKTAKPIRLYTLKLMPGSCVKHIRTNSGIGTYCVEFTKDHGAYKAGNQLCVMPYEVVKISV